MGNRSEKGGWFPKLGSAKAKQEQAKHTGGEWFSGRDSGADDYAKDQQGGDDGKGRKHKGMKSNIDGEGFSWWGN